MIKQLLLLTSLLASSTACAWLTETPTVLAGMQLTLNQPEDATTSSRRVKRGNKARWSRLWPDNLVPYSLEHASPSGQRAFLAAVHEIEQKTAVRFIPRSTQLNYLEVKTPSQQNTHQGRLLCADAHVGAGHVYQGKNLQALRLWPRCELKGVVLHELMHTLGFDHEHQRSDRDRYLTLHAEHAGLDQQQAASWLPTKNSQPHGVYDYRSVLHESGYIGSLNGQATLVPTEAGVTPYMLGRADTLSSGDVAIIQHYYPAPKKWLRPGNLNVTPRLPYTANTHSHSTAIPAVHRTDTPRTKPPLAPPPASTVQLISAYNQQCLEALPTATPSAQLKPCRSTLAQRWQRQADGHLVNAATPSHCLGTEPGLPGHERVATLPCRQHETQRWTQKHRLLINQSAPGSALSYSSAHAPMLFPLTSSASWQRWHWR